MGHTIDDLMFIYGYKKGVQHNEFDEARIRGENDWIDGKNADDNPYPNGKWPSTNNLLHAAWYKSWLNCNKNC